MLVFRSRGKGNVKEKMPLSLISYRTRRVSRSFQLEVAEETEKTTGARERDSYIPNSPMKL